MITSSLTPISADANGKLGLFAPTSVWDEKEKVLTVHLEQVQLDACLYRATNPCDDGVEARWGRALLKELRDAYLKLAPCGIKEVRFARRMYDGEPL